MRAAHAVFSVTLYLALIVILTWPLAIRLGSVIPHDLGDPLENTWILWWNAHAIPLTSRWWNGPIFWPAPGALALSEHLIGISVFTTPMQWIGASPILAYNLMFLLSFPLCAAAAHALAFTLTGRHDAGIVAGLIFGFNPYRIAESAHLQMLMALWMPVALVALHRYLDQRRRRWLVVFGLAWLMQALSNGYFLVFFPILIVLWIFWFVRDRRALTGIVTAWAISSVPLVPFLWKYRQVHHLFNLRREFPEILAFSPDVASFLDPEPGLMKIWRVGLFHQFGGELYFGFTCVVLIAIACGLTLWRSRRRVSTVSAVLLAASAVFFTVALSVTLFGPWEMRIANLLVASARVFNKPFTVAVVLLVAAVVVDKRFVDSFNSRAPLMFFVVAAGIIAILSLGPDPKFFGTLFLYRAPYRWLLALPGFDAFRVPARLHMLTVLCVSSAAALAFARLTVVSHDAKQMAIRGAVMASIAVESWFTMPLFPVPDRFQTINPAQTGGVIEIPLGDTEHDTPAMYRSMFHRRPLVNGAAGYAPPHYDILRVAIDDEDIAALDEMAASPLVVVVDTSREIGRRWAGMLSHRDGATALGFEFGRPVFRIPAVDSGAAPLMRERLPIEGIVANAQPSLVASMRDSNLSSNWNSGRPQRGDEMITIELGAARIVDAITLSLGRYSLDFPRRLTIESTLDDRIWTTCWSGRPASLALKAALRNPHVVPLTFPLASVRARRVRLRQTGSDPTRFWTIAELDLFGQ